MSLEAQHAAHPLNSEVTIELALELERQGRMAQAENTLLEAAREDRQLLPAWTLANFYFRRERTEDFWRWAARSADLTYDDFRPLLRLATSVEHDPRLVVNHLGNHAPLLRAYIDLLIGQHRSADARFLGEILAAHHDSADRDRLAALSRLH
jgi:hypothetical protein